MKKIIVCALVFVIALIDVSRFETSYCATSGKQYTVPVCDVGLGDDYVKEEAADGLKTVDEIIRELVKAEDWQEVQWYVIHCAAVISRNTLLDAMFAAIATNNKDMVSFLINHGVSMDEDQDGKGNFFLDQAIRKRSDAVVEPLIKAGARIRDHELHTPIMLAAQQGDEALLDELKRVGMDIHERKKGLNALSYAVMGGQTTIVHKLLRWGVEWSIKDKEHRTVLMIAAQRGDIDMVQLLVDVGVPLDAIDARGWNALRYAVHYTTANLPLEGGVLLRTLRWVARQTKMIQFLLSLGIDHSRLDVSDIVLTPEIIPVVEREIARVREARRQDWMPENRVKTNITRIMADLAIRNEHPDPVAFGAGMRGAQRPRICQANGVAGEMDDDEKE